MRCTRGAGHVLARWQAPARSSVAGAPWPKGRPIRQRWRRTGRHLTRSAARRGHMCAPELSDQQGNVLSSTPGDHGAVWSARAEG